MNVQIQMPEAAPTDYPDSYEPVICPACTRIHLINKTTGKMLGDHEKQYAAQSGQSRSRH
ncbi:MAG: hypothetical protein ACXWKP_02280 [Bradyrhizobium sp.]|jgi:hypothetical protein